jgi:hypothetical protein
MATPTIDITGLTRGDTERLRVTVTRDGSAVDLTAAGTVLWFTVKRNYSDSDSQAVIKKNSVSGGLGGIATTGTTGEAIITFVEGETDGVSITTRYHYDVQLVSGSNPVSVETVVKGEISWDGDVTRSIA